MHGIDAKDAGGTAQGAANRWWALALLTGIYCCHTIDRQVIAVVMEAIKQDLKLSDGYVGFLGGMAHALGFMITVIPLGMLADRVNRVRMLSGLVILWSMLTALGSLVSSAFTLALLRLGVGAAEGGGASTATALVADHFAPRQRGLAFGIFYASTAIGMALVFLFGGMMAHAYGWRAAFLLAGMPGIVMGILTVLTLREPIRGRFDVGGPAPSGPRSRPPSGRSAQSRRSPGRSRVSRSAPSWSPPSSPGRYPSSAAPMAPASATQA